MHSPLHHCYPASLEHADSSLSGGPSPAPALRPLGKDVLGRVGGELIFQTQPVSKRGHDERLWGLSVTTSQKPPSPYNFLKTVSGVQTMTCRHAGQGAAPRSGVTPEGL